MLHSQQKFGIERRVAALAVACTVMLAVVAYVGHADYFALVAVHGSNLCTIPPEQCCSHEDAHPYGAANCHHHLLKIAWSPGASIGKTPSRPSSYRSHPLVVPSALTLSPEISRRRVSSHGTAPPAPRTCPATSPRAPPQA